MSRTAIKLPRAESDLYRAFDDRIELVRVLHGARDIRQVLDDTGDDD
jgi:plasmid stabilization system protein ParE